MCRSAVGSLEGTMEFFSQWKERYSLSLDGQQEQAVQAVDGPVLLLAVPGSGKTTVLVSRVGYLCLARGIPPEQILTMTYTVAAARDMRARFAALFGEEAAERLEFRTINGVCSQIIRTYERRLGRTAFDLWEDAGQRGALLGELYRVQTGEFAAEKHGEGPDDCRHLCQKSDADWGGAGPDPGGGSGVP